MRISNLVLTTTLFLLCCVGSLSAESVDGVIKQVDSLAGEGEFGEALDYGLAALPELEAQLGTSDTAVATLMIRLVHNGIKVRKYGLCDSLVRLSLAIGETYFDDSHPIILQSLRFLSFLHLVRGEYAEAEPISLRALAGWERSEVRDTSYAVQRYNQMGVMYLNQGRASDAEEAYRQALELTEGGIKGILRQAIQLRNNLTYLYRLQNKYAEAEQILLEQIELLEDKGDSTYFETLAAAYHNIGELYADNGQYDEAEQSFMTSIRMNEGKYGADGYQVAFGVTSLGNAYQKQHRFEEAAQYYRRALKIKRDAVGLADRSVANTLLTYSRCALALGQTGKAIELAGESYDIRHANFVRNAGVLSEKEALEYAHIMRTAAEGFICAWESDSEPDPATSGKAVDIILSSKGQVTDLMFDRELSMVDEEDSEVISLLEQHRKTINKASSLYAKGPDKSNPERYRTTMDSLYREADQLESDLALRSASFHTAQDSRRINSEMIASLLEQGTVLLEYFRYQSFDPKTDSSEERYLAAVITSGAAPLVVPIGRAFLIDSVINEYRKSMQHTGLVWPALEADRLREYDKINDALYQHLIAPIESNLQTATTLLIAADGELNLVSFAGLKDRQGKYLIERFPLHYLSAGRDLLRYQAPAELNTGLLAMGDVDYGSVSDADPSAAIRSGSTLCQLPYSRREVARIVDSWVSKHGNNQLIHFGREATEEAFKRDAPGRRVIHCATHGYYSPSGGSETSADGSTDENPLLRSGLFFAGANGLVSSVDSSSGEDGFLSAWEVSGMNLEGTEWVVLSACESGLGGIKAGEGVWGLRRAFQMAGARTVISSLWPVPDKQTVTLMERLYSSDEKNIAVRMRNLTLDIIGEERGKNIPDHPYAWAGFIALGDWRISD